MMKYVWHAGAWREAVRVPVARRFHIISDVMPAALHPATGQTFESKSAFRAVTKANGFEELGNDAPVESAPYQPLGGVKEDVAEAIGMLKQGYQPPPVETVEPDTRIY